MHFTLEEYQERSVQMMMQNPFHYLAGVVVLKETDLIVYPNGTRRHYLYNTWSLMKDRCYNPNSNKFYAYGARGISVCDSWLGPYGFNAFVRDMGIRPKGLTLGRIDNNGNYEPGNCRWEDVYQQSANRRCSNKTVGVEYLNQDRLVKRWRAYLKVNGEYVLKKTFMTEQEAIAARKDAEKIYGI